MSNLSLITAILFLLLNSFFMTWLFKLYVRNKCYVRDIFLVCQGQIVGMMNVLSVLYHFIRAGYYLSALQSLAVMAYALFSIYLLTYISISSLKWWGNVLKSIIFILTLLSMVAKSTLLFHITIISICVISQFFCWFNNSPKMDKFLDILFTIATFIIVYALVLLQSSQNIFSYFVVMTIFNFVSLAIIINRIREVKSTTESKLSKKDEVEYF